MSDIRKRYMARLAGRILILVLGILYCIFDPAIFDILNGMNFFHGFSVMHLL
ncbi:MAG: hypothetical protein Q4B59_04525 [Lachnospiraceae bacterium]|nr:hypothetical protein [Lachnospiraceae bacterium]